MGTNRKTGGTDRSFYCIGARESHRQRQKLVLIKHNFIIISVKAYFLLEKVTIICYTALKWFSFHLILFEIILNKPITLLTTIINFGFHGIIGQKRFETEDEFASIMAAKDICIFGSHPHQVLLQNIFLWNFNSTLI